MLDIVWILLAAGIVGGALSNVLDRYVAKETSPYAFALLTQFLAALLFLPAALNAFVLPSSAQGWIALGISTIIWTMFSVTAYISRKKAEVSIKDPLSKSKFVWALLFAVIFLGEPFTIGKFVGTLIIFVGMTVLVIHPERKWGRITDPGVLWALFSAFLAASAAVADKYALGFMQPEVYGFLVYLLPGIVLIPWIPKKMPEIKHLFKARGISAVCAVLVATGVYYLILKLYTLADVSLIYPLLQTSTILSVLCGIFFLGEREHKWQKIAAAIIVVIGAIVLKFG
jgi:drug/metabolite transporter (DMT)-like permease